MAGCRLPAAAVLLAGQPAVATGTPAAAGSAATAGAAAATAARCAPACACCALFGFSLRQALGPVSKVPAGAGLDTAQQVLDICNLTARGPLYMCCSQGCSCVRHSMCGSQHNNNTSQPLRLDNHCAHATAGAPTVKIGCTAGQLSAHEQSTRARTVRLHHKPRLIKQPLIDWP